MSIKILLLKIRLKEFKIKILTLFYAFVRLCFKKTPLYKYINGTKLCPIRFGSELDYFFGLSYASYLTLPRSLLEDMPIDWQYKFGKLLYELDETFKCAPIDGKYFVYTRDSKGRFIEDKLKYYRHPDYNLIDSIRLKPRE